MSVHYIVDGYNAIHRFDGFDAARLSESRRRLCAYLEEVRPHGSARNKVTVVFDGPKKAPYGAGPWASPAEGAGSARVMGGREPWPFDVVYSIGETADDVILKRVRAARQPRNCVVVTDDKGLAFIVKKSGAAVMTVAHFLGAGPKRRVLRVRKGAADKASLNVVTRENITQELSRLWLKKR